MARNGLGEGRIVRASALYFVSRIVHLSSEGSNTLQGDYPKTAMTKNGQRVER
jgi:hypothetical protein